MGCAPSKPRTNSENHPENDSNLDDDQNSETFDGCDSDKKLMNKYDENVISSIKKDLNENPEMFVLNNVLMATFFLENYKREISEALETRLDNSKILIEPDYIIEKANKYVLYRPLRGPKQDIGEALITKRVYVPVNDFIEVIQDFEGEGHKTDNEKFKVKMEESHRRKGYVKLRGLYSSSIPNDDISQIEFLSVPTSSGSSDTDTYSDSTSAQLSISDLRIPKPIIGGAEKSSNYSLNNCFVYRKIKKADVDMDLEDLDIEHLTDEDVYDIVSYLSSTNFMKYFQGELFQTSIDRIVERNNFELVSTGWLPGRIFCNFDDIDGNNCPLEILPCLTISWPEQQTFEFLNRKTQITWPTQHMLEELKQLNCALVPRAISRRYKVLKPLRKDTDLEWEIHFPLAEKYLTTYLSNAQLKCFLILLTLHKEYIEPFTKHDGLLTEHLRHHIFWECENDVSNWAEHRLGFKLVSIIYNLSERLRKKHLNDYFIQNKNLLKNISKQYLEPSNEIFHVISQSPLMLTIRALRNLRNKSGRFYPPINFEELIKILKVQEGWELTNQNIVEEDQKYFKKPKPPMFEDAEKQLQYVKMQEKKKRMIERLKRRQEMANQKNLRKQYYNINVKNVETDDIDNLWQCEKSFDIHKKVAILKFFIQAFLDIAKVSSKIDTNRKTLFYLKQAYYLTKILDDECAAMNNEIEYFYKTINQEETKCLKEEHLFLKVEQNGLKSSSQVILDSKNIASELRNYKNKNNSLTSNNGLKTSKNHSISKNVDKEIRLIQNINQNIDEG